MSEQDQQDNKPVIQPYFVVEMPTEGGPGLYSDDKIKRASVRTLFAVAELADLERSTLWRTMGSRGLIVQSLAVAFLNNPGLFEAIGAMMILLQNDEERKKR